MRWDVDDLLIQLEKLRKIDQQEREQQERERTERAQQQDEDGQPDE